MTRDVLVVVLALFPVSEIALALVKRSRSGEARSEDRGSMRLLWLSIVLGFVLAFSAQLVPSTHVRLPRSFVEPVALALVIGGLAVRWVAILTLGRFFTVDVAVHSDHAVVQTGLYRYTRHPSYTGLLVAFLGCGVFFGDWLSLVALLAPITLAVVNRVVKEEAVLLATLGPAYASYCTRTKRFIPGLV